MHDRAIGIVSATAKTLRAQSVSSDEYVFYTRNLQAVNEEGSCHNSKASVKISRPLRAQVWGPSNTIVMVIFFLDLDKLRAYNWLYRAHPIL